jgi:receptor protein-tyrosine kinase
VHLNRARFRDDKIICPGNIDVISHNEFRTIKRRLLLAMQEADAVKDRPNTVLVTSAMPGEGKTFTALNLAISLAAERNMRVLLIDGDVVNHSLSGYFNAGDSTAGLTDLLDGRAANVTEVMHGCAEIKNLSVMFAGRPDPRAPELMASTRMTEILGELLRADADLFVVVDCSPVISPEPAALAPHVDHAIMVVAAQQTSRHQLKEALENLAACPRVSLLFNKSPRWRRNGVYYGYYGQTNQGTASLAAEPSANLGTP